MIRLEADSSRRTHHRSRSRIVACKRGQVPVCLDRVKVGIVRIGVGGDEGVFGDRTSYCNVDTVAATVTGWARVIALIEHDEECTSLVGEHDTRQYQRY